MSTSIHLDTPSELAFERSLYIGGQITGVLYGIQLAIYGVSCLLLLNKSATGLWSKYQARFYITYGALLITLWTVALACNAFFGQEAWIDHRDDSEGGPAAYIAENISAPYNTLGTTAGVLMNFLNDGLLIYRCYMIWNSRLIILFPVALYLGACSMSILLIYDSAQPTANFFSGHAIDFGVPYLSLTITLNIIVTALISGRILYLQNKIRKLFSRPHVEHLKQYTSVSAGLVESAAPFTALGIVYVVGYARHNSFSFALVQIWGDFCAISPQLIILRSAMGWGWTKETADRLSNLTNLTSDRSSLSHHDHTHDHTQVQHSVTMICIPELSFQSNGTGDHSIIDLNVPLDTFHINSSV